MYVHIYHWISYICVYIYIYLYLNIIFFFRNHVFEYYICFFSKSHVYTYQYIFIYAHVQDISFASFLGKCNKIQWTTQLEISAVKKSGDFPLDSRSTVKTRNFIWLGVWDCLGVANHGDVQNMLPQIQISIISFSISLDSQYFLFPSQWSFCIILWLWLTLAAEKKTSLFAEIHADVGWRARAASTKTIGLPSMVNS